MAGVIRYTFTGVLTTMGALHIGSGSGGLIGAGQPATDAAIIRDREGYPFIPGSSLRGALRAAVAQYAEALFASDDARLREDEGELNALREGVEAAVKSKAVTMTNEEAIQGWLDTELSALERLFGTVFWASPLTIPDLHLVERVVGKSDGEIRHGVGIDRDTGAARESIKYDFEVLPRGARFAFLLRCELPTVDATRLKTWEQMLALGLKLLQQREITLGGRAARGVGQVKLEELKVYKLHLSPNPKHRADLITALLAKPNTPQGTLEPGDWVVTTLKAMQGGS